MSDDGWLADQFEEHRPHLRAVAYRMLGSTAEADDALQDAWLRVSRSDTSGVENLNGWLTTVVARVCLNALRARGSRREDSLEVRMPEPILGPETGIDPEQDALLADSVRLAMLVVLDTLSPPERFAFVLHDLFRVPFEEIAPMLDRTPAATRQLASRARRRVRGQAPPPDADLAGQREIVNAFFAAARLGDLEGLVAVLHPDVVVRADGGTLRQGLTSVTHGAQAVAEQAVTGTRFAPFVRPAVVNGAAGVVVAVGDLVLSVMGFTVVSRRIVSIDVLYDPERLEGVDVSSLEG